MTSAPASAPPTPPWWVRLLDLAISVIVVLLISAVLFGGLRIRFDDVRVTAEEPWKLVLALALTLGARAALWRADTWWGRAWAGVQRVRGSRALAYVAPWVLTTRLLCLYATFLGVIVIGYPEGGPPFRASENEFRNLFARWDAGWYIGIADTGYNYWGNSQTQTNVAFFPAYPYTVRVAAGLLGARWGSPDDPAESFAAFSERKAVRLLQAGWLVSVLAFTAALAYLFRLARDLTDSEDAAGASVMLMATYPFAFFYGAMYTEGLFLLAALAAVWHFRKRQYAIAMAAGVIAGLTRPNGCFLSVALGIMALEQWRADGYRLRTLVTAMATAAGPGLGMLAFTAWLYSQTGEWFLWMRAHGAWGRQFSGVDALFRQRWSELTGWGLHGYLVGHAVEILNMLATFLVVGVSWPIGRRFGWAWSAFLLVTVLPPLFMGGFLSMGRVTSTLFPVFIYLGWRVRPAWRPHVMLAGFGLQVALAVMHFTWRQVY